MGQDARAYSYGPLTSSVSTIMPSLLPEEFNYSTISGFKFLDKNGDGLWQRHCESGIEGWVIYLYKWDNSSSQWVQKNTTLTRLNDFYSFTGLSLGIYKVAEGSSPNWVQTTCTRARS